MVRRLLAAAAVAVLATGCGGDKRSYEVAEVRAAFVANGVAIGRLVDFTNGAVQVGGRTLRAGEGVIAAAQGGLVRLEVLESDERAAKQADFWSIFGNAGFIAHHGNVAVQVSPPRPEQVRRVKAALRDLEQQ